MSEQHTMQLVETYPTGAERWKCPTCGYEFVMVWNPWKRIILAEGAHGNVSHSGGKGGLTIGALNVTKEEAGNDMLPDVFSDFLKSLDE